jgi:hypothetical protein
MLGNGTWRVFLAGALCGTIFTAVVGATWIWWKPAHPNPFGQFDELRSAEDEYLYDGCLANGRGTVACDAFMRVLDRLRADEAAKKKETAPQSFEAVVEKPPFDPNKPFEVIEPAPERRPTLPAERP